MRRAAGVAQAIEALRRSDLRRRRRRASPGVAQSAEYRFRRAPGVPGIQALAGSERGAGEEALDLAMKQFGQKD